LAIKAVSSPLISFHYLRLLSIQACHGVGFDVTAPKSTRSKLIVGYYQSFKWLDSATKRELESIEISNPSYAFLKLLEQIRMNPTFIVHVRLGDYLQDTNFGTPSSEYFKNALDKLKELRGEARIWGFSDEPDKANQILEASGIDGIFWVPTSVLSSSETLQLMREGSGFAIANSTFSWWAAALRKDSQAPVVAPKPWFRSMDEPESLVPPEWYRLDAY
jgi:hypothetical protein